MIKKLVPIALALVAATAALAACGDDEDRLSDEEYFAEVDQLNGALDEAFETEIFGAATAREGLDNFVTAVDTLEEGVSDLNPPEDVEDAHDRYVEEVEAAGDFVEQAAEDTPEDAPIEELETILFGEGDPFAEVNAAECELAGIAEEKGIVTEFLVCEDEEEGEEEEEEAPGPEAAGDNAVAVEAADFEFNIDGEFTTETTGFTFTNAGEQPHEAFILKISEDANVDELLASDEENPEGVEGEFGGTFAEPGNEAGAPFEAPLEPGRYLMLCFVTDPESGQPHALLGMVEEFTVE